MARSRSLLVGVSLLLLSACRTGEEEVSPPDGGGAFDGPAIDVAPAPDATADVHEAAADATPDTGDAGEAGTDDAGDAGATDASEDAQAGDASDAGASDASDAADDAEAGDAAGDGGAPGPAWTVQLGDTGYDVARAVTVDGAGNVLVTGWISGTVDLGGGPIGTKGETDAFVTKLDPGGAHLWSRVFGSSAWEEGQHVVADAAGNVYVTGFTDDIVDFGTGPLGTAGNGGVFLLKLDPSGTTMWAKVWEPTGNASGLGLAIASDGVVVSGHVQGSIDLGGGALDTAGVDEGFVAKYEASGAHLWSQLLRSTAKGWARDVVVTPAGHVLVAGYFGGALAVGASPSLSSAGGTDGYLVELDATGAWVRTQPLGGAGDDVAWAVRRASSGDLVVAGDAEGAVDLGGGALAGGAGHAAFVARFDANGGHVWSRRFGDGTDAAAAGLALDASDRVLIAGWVSGTTADFGGGARSVAGSADFFAALLDAQGGHVWSRTAGEGDWEESLGAAFAPDGRPVVIADVFTAMDLGNGSLVTRGSYDGLVAKY